MTPIVSRRPAALDDLDRIAEFIQSRSSSADRAIRFLREAEATFTRLARMPGIGTRYEVAGRVDEVRFFPVGRHRNHLVFYQATGDGIEILRVLHGARDIGHNLLTDFPAEEEDLT